MHGVARVRARALPRVFARVFARVSARPPAPRSAESRGGHRGEYLFDDYLRRPSVLFGGTELPCKRIRKNSQYDKETLMSRHFQFNFIIDHEMPYFNSLYICILLP